MSVGIQGNPSKRGIVLAGEAILERDPAIEALLTAEAMLTKGKWCKDALARTADGTECSWDDEEVDSYSLEGALLVGASFGPAGLYDEVEALVAQHLPEWAPNITAFNDAPHMKVSAIYAVIHEAVATRRKA